MCVCVRMCQYVFLCPSPPQALLLDGTVCVVWIFGLKVGWRLNKSLVRFGTLGKQEQRETEIKIIAEQTPSGHRAERKRVTAARTNHLEHCHSAIHFNVAHRSFPLITQLIYCEVI